MRKGLALHGPQRGVERGRKQHDIDALTLEFERGVQVGKQRKFGAVQGVGVGPIGLDHQVKIAAARTVIHPRPEQPQP